MRTTMGVAIALAAVLASPAFAQSTNGGHNDAFGSDAYGAYAREVQPNERARTQQHSPNPSWDVYNTEGRYVGSDPDPRVRDMLSNDANEESTDY
jgi:hypothetical protein